MTDQNLQSLFLGKIAAYTEILVKDPNSTIFVSLAETYRKMGMFDDARQIILKGLELHPDFSPAFIVLGRVLCQLEDFDGSVTAFESALQYSPESLAALVGYARVKILLGDEAAAKELLLRARELSPADPVINKLLLSLPDECLSPPAVEEETEGEILTTETVPLISSTLADLYFEQGLIKKALDIYQKLLQQNPDDLTLRRRLKDIESQLENDSVKPNDEEGIETLAVAEEPSSPGSVLSAMEQKDPVLETLNLWLSNIRLRRTNVS